MTRPKAWDLLDHEHITLVLQGGGALGSYQAGVFEEIAKVPREPTWVAGISIGAINAALIVGNPAHRRVQRLREFWELVSRRLAAFAPLWEIQPSAFHRISAATSALVGVEGFYRPQLLPATLHADGSPGALGVYDTSPLRETLERLVDFDLINSRKVRLSVGAVNVRTGNSIYFDNTRCRIGPEHIMASGALPPAFPPVVIDGEAYWDGGVVANTPLQYVLDERPPGKMMIAQVDLFSARGAMPTNMAGVLTRQKDIMYSSRTRFNTDQAAASLRHRQQLRRLIDRLPPKLRADPEVQQLLDRACPGHIDIVHLIYRQSRHELESKDYEFSDAALKEHWEAGRRDMRHTVLHPEWLKRSELDEGVTVYDLAHRGDAPC